MKRVPLFDRLPEIHRIKDREQASGDDPGPLQAYLSHVENAFTAVKGSAEALYHDLFIETCADWVIPYLGDLLGTSHLAGDPWTLRADVADTILLRRAKGTLGAIERIAFDLTKWGAHPVELRENLAWTQALNHQRPDRGGLPAYGDMPAGRHTAIRGGFATIRDPAMLSLLGTPFDPFTRFPELSIARNHRVAYNLPNLAIFLWRLATYRIEQQTHLVSPLPPIVATGHAAPLAGFVARFHVDPLGRPLQLFGRSSYDANQRPPVLTPPDQQPTPISRARLTSPPAPGEPGSHAGNPGAYVEVRSYDPALPHSLVVSALPLQLHVPDPSLDLTGVTFRGANLCAWEAGLAPPLRENEVAIDPVIGRIACGCAAHAVAQALVDHLVLTYTYGAVGPVGAAPPEDAPATAAIVVDHRAGSPSLEDALGALATVGSGPLEIELGDSEIHDLDIAVVADAINEGGWNLALARPLILRARTEQRPIVRLAAPLRFRPNQVAGTAAELLASLFVRCEGITFVAGQGFAAADPLMSRASVHSVDLRNCTFDPGGARVLSGGRTPSRTAMRLDRTLGFVDPNDYDAFGPPPRISVTRSITGPLFVDADAYKLWLTASIVDGGPAADAMAIAGSGDPLTTFAARTVIDAVTIFGASRVQQISGRGGIFDGRLVVDDDQSGCLKLCWFSGDADRLPQNTGCVHAPDARLLFTTRMFGEPAYGQLSLDADRRIRERGPNDDQMGAFGFLLEAHKWKNLNIRLRELTPAGVRALLIPAT